MIRAAALIAALGLAGCGADGVPLPFGEPAGGPSEPTIGVVR